MKKPEEYLIRLFEEPFNLEEGSIESDFLEVIKEAQLDAIDIAVKRCGNLSELIYVKSESEIPEGALSTGDPDYGYHYVDIIKIFQVAEELKKEIQLNHENILIKKNGRTNNFV